MKFSRFYIVLFISASFLFIRCGSKPKQQQDDKPVTNYPLLAEVEIYESYPFGDTQCQSSVDDTTITSATLTELTPIPKEYPKIGNQNRALNGISSKNGLKNSIVNLTTAGEFWDRQCPWSLSGRGQNCVDPDRGTSRGWTLQGSESPLRACSSAANFQRRSHERTALQSLNAIEQAYRYFRQSSSEPLPPIKLQIFPKFRTVFTEASDNSGNVVNKVFYIASNLVYFPAGERAEQQGSIAVAPERRIEVQDQRPGLWESEFAAAHEFGHHIQRMQLINRRLSFYQDSHFSALAESFADLTAFYSLGENSSAVESLPCFGFNRSPIQSTFYDGTPKVFSGSIQQTFAPAARAVRQGAAIMEPVFATMDACSQPVFTSPHDVSAIFTFNLNRLFESVAKQIRPNSLTERTSIKYKIAIAWSQLTMERLSQKSTAQSSKDYSNDFLRLIISTAEETVLNLSKNQYGVTPDFRNWCQLRREGFPTLQLSSSAANCP